MAGSFENLNDNIFSDWSRDQVQKTILSRHWTGTRSKKKNEKAVSSLENDSEIITQTSSTHTQAASVGSRARLKQTQEWSLNYFKATIALSRI